MRSFGVEGVGGERAESGYRKSTPKKLDFSACMHLFPLFSEGFLAFGSLRNVDLCIDLRNKPGQTQV